MTARRLLVTGSRHWSDRDTIRDALREAWRDLEDPEFRERYKRAEDEILERNRQCAEQEADRMVAYYQRQRAAIEERHQLERESRGE